MSCCPTDSWAQLGAADYTDKGSVERVGDLDIYVVGKGERCVIWNYDIFGFNSGRTRQLADLLAEAGFMVAIPDYFRGTWQDPFGPGALEFLQRTTRWSNLKVDWEDKILPLVKRRGAKKISAVGTCWGSYMVLRLSALPEVSCGVSIHPSHTPICSAMAEDERVLMQQVAKNKCPQLFMAAGNDSPDVKKGGLADAILGEQAEFELFAEMAHGWSTRGDMAVQAVERDVKKAINMALQFFNKHM